MNAVQQMQLAAALAEAIEKAGIVVERAELHRGNVRGWQPVDSGAVAARTVGAWMSWNWSASVTDPERPPRPVSPHLSRGELPEDPPHLHLRLLSPEVNNDNEDDGA